MRRIIAAITIVAAVGGCASTKDYRQLASSTGIYVETLKAGTAEFVEGQNQLNIESAERLDSLVVRTNALEATARRQEMAWTLQSNGREVASYQSATGRTGEAIVQSMKSKASRAGPLDDAGAGAAYGKASEALAQLSAKPSRFNILAGILAYADAVSVAYEKLKDEASKDAADTSGESETADNATTTEDATKTADPN